MQLQDSCEWHPLSEQKMEGLAKVRLMRLWFLDLPDKQLQETMQCWTEPEINNMSSSMLSHPVSHLIQKSQG